MKVDVLGVEIDDINTKEAVEMVVGWLKAKDDRKHYIVTPNPEFVMLAQKDEQFKGVLNRADLAIPDGVGLKRFAGFKNVVGGVYFLEEICKVSADLGFTTGFLGGRGGVAKEASECLQKKYPGLKVVFAEDGPEVDKNGNVFAGPVTSVSPVRPRSLRSPAVDARDLSFVPPANLPSSDILFVGFGQVKQEKWIAKNLDKLSVKVVMGVGGSFDEISGRVPRFPQWVQTLGLKWLFRLLSQPWRFKRQLAIWQFAWRMIGKSGRVKERT